MEDMLVPDQVKPELRNIHGMLCSTADEVLRVLKSMAGRGKIITVGDVTSYTMISAGINPDIIVYDGLEKRDKAKSWMKNLLEAYIAERRQVKNPPSHLTGELWQAAFEALRFKGKTKIFVQGEEDLAVVPLIIMASVGDVILYGVPNRGMDLVVVDDHVKDKFKRIMRSFREDKESEEKKAKRLKEERIKEMFSGKRR